MVNFTDVCEMCAKGAFVGTTRNSSSNRVKTRLGLASIAVAGALLLSGCTANEAFFFDMPEPATAEAPIIQNLWKTIDTLFITHSN